MTFLLLLQVVAAVRGKLVSVYDGVSEYKLGQTLHAKRGGAAWAPLDACYFAFPNMHQVAIAVAIAIAIAVIAVEKVLPCLHLVFIAAQMSCCISLKANGVRIEFHEQLLALFE